MKSIRLGFAALVFAVVAAGCDATSITANECGTTVGSEVRSCG
ncbi:MAG: hypothetical protein WD766_11260 [Gemmatimonadota bacterium]